MKPERSNSRFSLTGVYDPGNAFGMRVNQGDAYGFLGTISQPIGTLKSCRTLRC